MAVRHINEEDFDKEVLGHKGVSMVDFYADWCGPCKMLSPVVEMVSEERPDVTVFKIDVDKAPDLAAKYKVFSIPFVMVFKDGELYKKSVGAVSKNELLSMLD